MPCLVVRPHFIAPPRPGLTPDDFTRGREVVEGVQGFQPQQWRRAKSKDRPSSGDRSVEACPTRYTPTSTTGIQQPVVPGMTPQAVCNKVRNEKL